MVPLKHLDTEGLRELLVESWMTHDAMWFRHCLEACGIETTNRLNQAAVRSMAAIEARRLVRALGLSQCRSMGELRQFIEAAWGAVKADFMDFALSYPASDVIRCDVRRCFALEGVRQLGVADAYECGIFPRVEAWFDALGARYTVSPEVRGCMMQTAGTCHREYTFTFGAAS